MSSTILRQVASATRTASRARSFASSAVTRRDLVQDLYVKELKSYKAPPAAKDAHVGTVKAYSAPAAPQVPTLPSDLASELSAFDASEPTKASADVAAATGSAVPNGAEAFLTFLEADEVEEHHGH